MADWLKIKTEYINTTISQRKLADKYGVSFNTLKDKANREKWAGQRTKSRNKITAKAQQKIEDIQSEKIVKQVATIEDLTQTLLDNIQIATTELTQRNEIVTKKTKTKVISYTPKGKTDNEVVTEQEEKSLEIYYGGVKVDNLKMLASALKDLQGVQNIGKQNNSVVDPLDKLDKLIEGITNATK